MGSVDSAVKRVVVVSAVLVGLLVIVGALAVDRYQRSASSYRAALAAGGDRLQVEAATARYWQERDAMLADAVRPGASTLASVEDQAGRFRAALGAVVAETSRERAAIRAASIANRALVASFARDRGTLSGQAFVEATRKMADRVVPPLDELLAFNEREVATAEKQAADDDVQARMFAIVAGAILVLVAVAACLYFGRLVKRIADQNRELRRLDSMKDDLIGMVSHELRTPLTSIRGFLELLLDEDTGPLTDEQRRFVSIADRSSDRLLRVVSDLLFVAQLDAASLRLELEPMQLEPVVARAVEAAQPAAEMKGIVVGLTVAESVPDLLGDGPRLAQVFDNLIANAVKFTNEGGVEVSLRRDADTALIEVVDTGIGIPDDEVGRLFDRFFRASSATTNAVQGTGLGLSIAKAIVEGHGGSIDVHSLEGRGTTFRVRLPLGGPTVETTPPAPALTSS